MASVLSRSSLRLLWLPRQPQEVRIVCQSSAAGAANQKYLSELDSIKQVMVVVGLSMLFVTEKISKKIFFSETLRTHPYTKYTMYYCLYSIQIDEKCAF